ncbi:hypothetical protein ACRAVF_18970 [Bradyrhizobium oligotrophicum S58]
MRRPAAKTNPKPRAAQLKTFLAPTSGWIANQNLLLPNARKPDGSTVNGASVLENWFPTATGIRMRGGSDAFAQIGSEDDPVVSLFSYHNGNVEKLFATTAGAIYDVSSPASPTNIHLTDESGNFLVDELGRYLLSSLSIPAGPAVDLLAGGDWSVAQFSTPGGTFLRLVNGVDTPLVFDGTSWSTSPAITGVDPTTLSFVFASKFRLWFIQKDSLNVYYLPVNSIGGAATLLPLGGIFSEGGSLMFGATWSIESGNGPSEQTVFVTSEGQVAAYVGSDPSDPTTWSRQGVYHIGKPLGPHAFVRTGGDVAISTNIGLIPLSSAFQRDIAALAPVAVSYSIEIEWNKAVAATVPSWQIALWPTKQMMLVAPPTPAGSVPKVLVANVRTGAWAPFTGWNVTCMQVFSDRLFFGSDSGKIVEAEVTGADQGSAYTATCAPLFDPLKSPAALKTGLESRVVLRATSRPTPKLSLQSDYVINLPVAPDDTTVVADNTWGTGKWGEAKWGSVADKQTYQTWGSTPGGGYSLSTAVQITSGSFSAPDVELVSLDLLYDVGDVAT